MKTFIYDLRYAVRALGRRPGFTAAAVLTLALGIGANTAIFSVINTVLLRPLPYDNPDRLVMVWEEASFAGFPRNTPAPANYADWKARNQIFEDMAAIAWRDFSLTGDGEPEKVSAYSVTFNLFSLLGVEPALGRTFLTGDDAPEAGKVAMISHGLWQRRYGGEPDIIGRDILLNGEKHTVVGVMPRGFQFLSSHISIWAPISFTAEDLANRRAHYLTVVARMNQGVTVDQAQADIQAITEQIGREHPAQAGRLGAVVLPIREQLAGGARRPLMVLLVAVAFVLLIACANVANLLLARAAGRRKEIAIRAALGAGRLRIFRQLLTESLLLSVIGGVAGLLMAAWSFTFLSQLIPEGLSLSTSLSIDSQTLAFTLAASVITGIIFGIVPAFHASSTDLNEALKQGGGRTGVAAARSKLRRALIVGEVALALVLLIGAGLLIQTVAQLQNQYSGFQAQNVLTLRTVLPRTRYDTHQKRVAFYNQALERVEALPGVLSAGYTTTVPLEWKGGTSGFVVEGRALDSSLSYDANHRNVSAGYLRTIGIPVRRGRHFEDRDNALSMPVAIINETMARQYWAGEDALGKRFKVGGPDSSYPWITVVGIAGDVRQMGVDLPVKAEMYFPYQQVNYNPWFAPRDMVIRTNGDPMGLVAAVRHQIHVVDPEQPVSNIRTLSEILGEQTEQQWIAMILLSSFAGLALLLASIGIYGILAYYVVQHTAEIGLRMAIGARSGDILRMVLRRGLSLALLGSTIGLVASLIVTRLISSLLFEVSSTDPLTFSVMPVLLMIVALLACYIPARRAAAVDPIVALRDE